MSRPQTIGIALGDMTGISPEVTLKALAAEAESTRDTYILLGDPARLHACNQALDLRLPLQSLPDAGPGARFLIDGAASGPLPEPLPCGDPTAARAALAWLVDGAARCLRGEFDALVTAPLNKEAVNRSGTPFIGQTELLTDLAGRPPTAMMLLGYDERGRWLRVMLATTHLALRAVADALTPEGLDLTFRLAAESCRQLRLPRARIAVCGLNPHAGEGGHFGDEEIRLIAPAIAAARARGLDLVGPLPGDTVFHEAASGAYDVVVAMYHDQGLAPLKLLAFDTGVNWTVGLPFVRTSPDHGTAYNIAGRGVANPSSMRSALRLARELAQNRTP